IRQRRCADPCGFLARRGNEPRRCGALPDRALCGDQTLARGACSTALLAEDARAMRASRRRRGGVKVDTTGLFAARMKRPRARARHPGLSNARFDQMRSGADPEPVCASAKKAVVERSSVPILHVCKTKSTQFPVELIRNEKTPPRLTGRGMPLDQCFVARTNRGIDGLRGPRVVENDFRPGARASTDD